MARTKASTSRNRLNKRQFTQGHAKRHRLTQVAAGSEIVRVLDSILRETVAGNDIAITGFGTIKVIIRPARDARNPQTGEIVSVAEHKDVKLVLGENYADFLNQRRRMPRKGIAVGKAPKGTAPSPATLRRTAARKTTAK